MWKGQNNCPEVGNLPWICHNYWRQCRYAGDDARLREKLFPLLKRAMNFYLTILETGPDGKFHLPCTYSPELWYAPDCNYDLASLPRGATWRSPTSAPKVRSSSAPRGTVGRRNGSV